MSWQTSAEPKLLTVSSSSCVSCVCVFFYCLSRIPVQRPGAGGGGGSRPGSSAAAPRAGGCQLLLPASLRPADVHHAYAVQQENSHQRQGQRNGGGQSRLPVSALFSCGSRMCRNLDFLFPSTTAGSMSLIHSCLQREHLLWVYLNTRGSHRVTLSTTGFCCMNEYKLTQRFIKTLVLR